jgi:hypothetical protein
VPPRISIYTAQIIVTEKDLWFKQPEIADDESDQDSIAHSTVIHRVHGRLFPAVDDNSAYESALRFVEGYGDRNYDGPGHVKLFEGIGIYQLTRVADSMDRFMEYVDGLYGASTGSVSFGIADASDKVPKTREKHELQLFSALQSYNPSVEPYEPG